METNIIYKDECFLTRGKANAYMRLLAVSYNFEISEQ